MKIVFIISPYFDYLTATLIEGLQELGHEIIASENSNYATKTSDRKLRRIAEQADLIVVCSNHRVRTWLMEDIENPRKVFVDGDDSHNFGVYPHIKFKAVFKRELNRFWQNNAAEPVYPLPFAAEKRYFHKTNLQRDIRVSFAARLNSNTMRYSIYQRLRNRNDSTIFCGSTGEQTCSSLKKLRSSPMGSPKYREILFRSQISVNVAGAGYDCARFWEILAAGALLFTQEVDITIPHPFSDGVNCVVFKSLDEFEEKLDGLLSNSTSIAQIADAGYQHLLKYHTTQSRAGYFLDIALANIYREGCCESFFAGPSNHPLKRKIIMQYNKILT